jgi:hypothetical protein
MRPKRLPWNSEALEGAELRDFTGANTTLRRNGARLCPEALYFGGANRVNVCNGLHMFAEECATIGSANASDP